MKVSLTLEQWLQVQQYALNDLGLSSISKSDCDLSEYIPHYNKWISNEYHADLDYMVKHGSKRFIPNELVDGTNSVIVTTLNYLNKTISTKEEVNKIRTTDDIAKVSVYAHGRDYHKVMKKKLQKLAEYINTLVPEHNFRVFTDSAPVLEKPLAEKAGLGWIGKNSMLMNTNQGSFFFIGTIYSNLELSHIDVQQKQLDICGKCQACIKLCPTNAIKNGKMIDSKRCISYLTIENKNAIPLEFRKQIGTRVYGCDDCQLVCPYNSNAPTTFEADFTERGFLVNKSVLDLFNWNESDFLKNTEGSAIRRIGYRAWIRNIAIAIGNSPKNNHNLFALNSKLVEFKNDSMVSEHIKWAIGQQTI